MCVPMYVHMHNNCSRLSHMHSSAPSERPLLGTGERRSSKEVVSDEGELVWDICAFISSKAGLIKEGSLTRVVSQEVLLQ